MLDIACGAGRFTRRMAARGVSIVAIDQSEVFLNRARSRTDGGDSAVAERIDCRLLDASGSDSLLELGERGFDAAVATMSIMDMASITAMISTVSKLLKPGGHFAWSILHPAFRSGTARLFAEEEYRDSKFVQHYGARVTEYLTAHEQEGIAGPGQPNPQNYFHRPVGMLLNTCFGAGFVLDGIEEPSIPPGYEDTGSNPLSWSRIHDVPQVLVVRLRLHGATEGRASSQGRTQKGEFHETSPDFPEFNESTAEDWDNVADWWDNAIGNGNAMTNVLEPAQERLLGLDPDDQLLEIGCGAGRFARHMAATGVRVTAFDRSEVFINRAQERTSQHADRITYDVLNATGPYAA